MTPSITESLYMLGEKENVVGITTFCRRVSYKQRVIGTYLEPNIEEIVRLNPDFVFISKEGTRKEIVENLERFKLKVVVFDPTNSFEDIKKQFLSIASFVGKKSVAQKIIKDYENKLLSFRRKSSKKVLCVLGLQPLIVASERSYIGEIIRFAGGENIVKSEIKYPQMNIEQIIKLGPEVILLSDMGVEEKEIRKFFSQYNDIPAVKNNKIFVLESDVLCQPTIKNFYILVEKMYWILNE